jgi:hypothetical protein
MQLTLFAGSLATFGPEETEEDVLDKHASKPIAGVAYLGGTVGPAGRNGTNGSPFHLRVCG